MPGLQNGRSAPPRPCAVKEEVKAGCFFCLGLPAKQLPLLSAAPQGKPYAAKVLFMRQESAHARPMRQPCQRCSPTPPSLRTWRAGNMWMVLVFFGGEAGGCRRALNWSFCPRPSAAEQGATNNNDLESVGCNPLSRPLPVAMPAPADVLLLDGGTGHRLKAMGVEQLVSGLRYDELFLAGSLANAQQPDLVRAVHEEYVGAGADVITTNSFSCTPWSLAKIGREQQAEELAAAAARIARGVADGAGRRVLVAGDAGRGLPCRLAAVRHRGTPRMMQFGSRGACWPTRLSFPCAPSHRPLHRTRCGPALQARCRPCRRATKLQGCPPLRRCCSNTPAWPPCWPPMWTCCCARRWPAWQARGAGETRLVGALSCVGTWAADLLRCARKRELGTQLLQEALPRGRTAATPHFCPPLQRGWRRARRPAAAAGPGGSAGRWRTARRPGSAAGSGWRCGECRGQCSLWDRAEGALGGLTYEAGVSGLVALAWHMCTICLCKHCALRIAKCLAPDVLLALPAGCGWGSGAAAGPPGNAGQLLCASGGHRSAAGPAGGSRAPMARAAGGRLCQRLLHDNQPVAGGGGSEWAGAQR